MEVRLQSVKGELPFVEMLSGGERGVNAAGIQMGGEEEMERKSTNGDSVE